MATTTTKLALTKPDLTDARDIRVLNTNFDIIDKSLTGNVNGQFAVTVSGTPSITMGAAAGTAPPAAVVTNCNDSRGLFTYGTGTAPTTGTLLTFTFGTAFAVAPRAVLLTFAAAINADGTGTHLQTVYVSSITTTTFVLSCSVAPILSKPNTTYGFTYLVVA